MDQRGGRIGLLGDLDRLPSPQLAGLEVGHEHDALGAEAVRGRQLRAGAEALEAGDGQVDLPLRLLLLAQEPAEATQPASRVEGRPLGANRLGQRDRLLLQLGCLVDLTEQVPLLRGSLDHLGTLGRIVLVGGGRVHEPAKRLAVGVEGLRAIACQREVVARLGQVVAVAVVPRQLGDLLLAAVLLQPGADPPVQRRAGC